MKGLTDAELLLLGLVAEMPRHGYEFDQVIEQRGTREWTQMGMALPLPTIVLSCGYVFPSSARSSSRGRCMSG